MTSRLFLVSSLLWAFAAGGLAWALLRIITQPRYVDPEQGRFEESRRAELRAQSTTYRLFEPWIDEWAARLAARKPVAVDRVERDLIGAAEPAPWRPAERLAAWWVEAAIAAAVVVGFGKILGSFTMAAILGIFTAYFYQRSKQAGLTKRSLRRRRKIKRLLASAIDLLALMMEVGGNFHESLATVAQRMRGTPLGDELARVMADIEAGRPRREALRSFADRVADDDAQEMVFALVQGEELGTPLASILRNQADQMRQKRSQWAERASEEAQVTIIFPAMIIMVACLIIVAAPFILVAMMS